MGIGLAQRTLGADYPLVFNGTAPSDDIRFLLADFSLFYWDPADYYAGVTAYAMPLRIGYLGGFGILPGGTVPAYVAGTYTHAQDIVVLDAVNRVVFDSTLYDSTQLTFTQRAWTPHISVTMWDAVSAQCHIAYFTTWPVEPLTTVPWRDYLAQLTPVNAVLDARTVMRQPPQVTRMQVALRSFDGPVELHEGYNVRLTVGDTTVDGFSTTTQIVVDAVSGVGAGVYPACGPQSLNLRTINNVAPTAAGDFRLAAAGCYWVRRPIRDVTSHPIKHYTGDTTPATLQAGNDCGPCCSCNQFVSVAQYMNRVRNRYKQSGRNAESVRDQYHVNRRRWKRGWQCYVRNLLRLQLQPQICPSLDVLGQFCNWTDACLSNLELTFDFSDTPAAMVQGVPSVPAATVTPEFTSTRGVTRMPFRRAGQIERGNVIGVWPRFTRQYDIVEPYQNVWVKFRLRFADCGVADDNAPFAVDCNLSATLNGIPIHAPLEGEDLDEYSSSASGSSTSSVPGELIIHKTTTLRCPPDDTHLYNASGCFSRRQIYRAIERI